jgi:glycosyltransferase involved in cell wall biosynthesis
MLIFKILIDCSNMRSGGAIQNGLAFLSLLSKSQFNEWFVAISPELNKEFPNEYKDLLPNLFIINGSNNIYGILKVIRQMKNIEKIISPDIVFSLSGPPYWRAKGIHISGFAKPQYLYPAIEKLLNTKLNYHEMIKRKIKLILQKKMFNKMDYLVGQTDIVKKRACKALDFPKIRFFIIHNSYSQLFKQSICDKKLNISINFKSNSTRVFIPSAYYLHKNLEIVPLIASYLKKINKEVCFVFTIEKRSSEWKNIKGLAKRLKVEEMLKTIGQVAHKNLSIEYIKSNIILLPTLLECSSAVCPEAMMVGRPIVTTDLDFSRSLCGESALYYNYDDPKSAAEHISAIIDNVDLKSKLINAGKIQLKNCYPSPSQKFNNQLDLINTISKMNKL